MAKLVKMLFSEGQEEAKERGGDGRSKFSIYQREIICIWVDDDFTLTLKKLSEKIRLEIVKTVSNSGELAKSNNFVIVVVIVILILILFLSLFYFDSYFSFYFDSYLFLCFILF